MLRRVVVAGLLVLAGPACAQDSFQEQRAEWNRPVAPFRILGNVHYVGTAGISAYLITGNTGHVLVDGAMEESAAQIAANIRRLGFRLEDVRYILINHAHWDHAGGLAELKRLTGAQLVASAADAPDLAAGANSHRDDTARFPPVTVDRIVGDGEALTLGSLRLTAHLTPGHTPGCTSWSLPVRQDDRTLAVLFACSLSVAGQPLAGDTRYPDAAEDFWATFARLLRLRADVFLGFHPNHFDFEAKRTRLAAGDRNAFVDPGELARQVDQYEAAFAQELERQRAAR